MIKYYGKKVTVNQLAKIAVQDKGACAEYFLEGEEDIDKTMTDKEHTEFYKRVEHHKQRVWTFLGMDSVNPFNK